MNIYGIIILTALLFDYFLNLYADLLNINNLKPDLPEEFKDVFSQQKYAKSQKYTKVKTKFGVITSTFNLLVILFFWFSGGFNFVDNIVRSWQLHPIITGLFYIGILIFFKTLLSLPFTVYATFVIEEKFGFNKTTLKIFITDLIKGFALTLVIGTPILGGILAFFQYAGDLAWFYCWIVTTLFTILLQYIAPRWILPLFNKFEPLEDGELKERIYNYTNSVGYKLSGIFVMDGSKRSTKSNAFFTGFGRNRRVALFDTLIQKHSISEMIAVLAHE
ncbi:MAG: M48 family metallopeptidase, partial [bacterium]